jgi:nickel transport protein
MHNPHNSRASLRLRLAVASMLATATLAAQAHGVWVAQRAGEWTLVLGDGPADDAYKADAVKSVQAVGPDGASLHLKLRPEARNVTIDNAASAAAVALSFEDGHWAQGADGKWVAGSKSAVPGARKAGFYMMYTTTLLAPRPAAYRPFGLPLEIVPLADPMHLGKGQPLRVQVLFDGKPLAGAKISPDYVNDPRAKPVIADAHGRAVVTLRSDGLNVIKVSHTRPRADRTEADEDGFAATLAFTLPQPKDD